MTREELYTAFIAISNMYLKANSSYIMNWKVYDFKSMSRQLEILLTCNIYLKSIKFYVESFDDIQSIIDIKLIYNVIDELVKLLTIFKSYYNEE